MKFIAAGLSDVGMQREHNEDCYCILPQYSLFIVADGMGGHRAGDVASQMATQIISDFFESSQATDHTWPFSFDPDVSMQGNRLLTGIKLANRQIFETSVRYPEVQGMGTTVVGLALENGTDRVWVAHVGDSRVYRVRDGELAQLTRDHSLLNDYLTYMPDMPEEALAEVPRNVITRALGMQDQVKVDMAPERAMPGDLYLLCSDGLNGMVDDPEINELVADHSDDLERCAEELIRKANANGGDDNVTVVVMRVLESGELVEAGESTEDDLSETIPRATDDEE